MWASESGIGVIRRTWRTGGDCQHTDNCGKPAGGPETRLCSCSVRWPLGVHIAPPVWRTDAIQPTSILGAAGLEPLGQGGAVAWAVHLAPMIASASPIWHGTVSKPEAG